MAALLFLAVYYFTLVFLPYGLRIMAGKGLLAKNYRQDRVPTPTGVILIAVFLFVLAAVNLFVGLPRGWPVFFLILFLSGSGLVDDWMGETGIKGFKGHLSALKQGRLTTGVGKALGGGLASLYGAWVVGGADFLLVNALIIALSTNFINLLDLRPGRANKVFLAVGVLILIAADEEQISWLWILMGIMLAYLPWDLRAQGMMGDTGANALGFALGIGITIAFSYTVKVLILLLLAGIHLYAERYSISQLINKVSWLSYLDKLGRTDP